MAEAVKAKLKNVKTPRALGCYVTLAKPRAMEVGKDPEYSVALLWPKTTDLSEIKRAIDEAVTSKWGPGAVRLLGGKLKNPLKDGDLPRWMTTATWTPSTRASGSSTPAASSACPSSMRTSSRWTRTRSTQGCYFHAQLRFYPFDWKGQSKGVGCGFQNIMLVGKGKRIDGRETAEQAFKDFTPDVVEGEGGDEVDDLLG
jgi:hypothetical protein